MYRCLLDMDKQHVEEGEDREGSGTRAVSACSSSAGSSGDDDESEERSRGARGRGRELQPPTQQCSLGGVGIDL